MDVFPSRTLGPLSVRLLCYEPGAQLARHHHAGATLSLMLEGGQRESVGQRHYDCTSHSAVLKGGGIEHANMIGPGSPAVSSWSCPARSRPRCARRVERPWAPTDYGAHFRAALVRNQGLPQYQDLIPPGTLRTTTAWPPRLPM